MKNVIKVARPYILILLALVTLVTGVLVVGMRPVSGSRKPVRVTIRKGSNAGDVALVLSKKGLIRSQLIFKLACRMGGNSSKLKPGVYEMNEAMGVSDVIGHLVKGDTLESLVTVPEGFTVRQIADVLSSKRLADGSAFVQSAISGGSVFVDYPFLAGENLEGYLFPDTYLVPRDADAESVIRQMLDAFQQKVFKPCRADIERTIAERFGMKPDEIAEGLQRVLTMASLVEREAKVPQDRPLIAAVLWNRLAKHMRLEVDATVSYVPGESTDNKEKVYLRDLSVNSPYNTYKNGGLPPAPICNPGLASIKAVMDPAKVDYLFYVAKPDGSHVFTRTFAEHLSAKRAVHSGGH